MCRNQADIRRRWPLVVITACWNARRLISIEDAEGRVFDFSRQSIAAVVGEGRIPGLTVGVPIAHNKGVSWGVVEDGSKVGSVVSGEDVG